MRRHVVAAAIVLRKELTDALRDRRTLLTVLVSAVLMGPLILVAISSLVASLESRAEQREVYVAGAANAPSLRNFLERQTYTVKEAPADYEAALRKSQFTDPVVVVRPDFERALARGESPVVEIVSDSANQRSEASTRSYRATARRLRSRAGDAQSRAARRRGPAARADPGGRA